jgi:hypothetical protein
VLLLKSILKYENLGIICSDIGSDPTRGSTASLFSSLLKEDKYMAKFNPIIGHEYFGLRSASPNDKRLWNSRRKLPQSASVLHQDNGANLKEKYCKG